MKHIIKIQFKINTVIKKKFGLFICFLIFVLARIIRLEIQNVKIINGVFKESVIMRRLIIKGELIGGVHRIREKSASVHSDVTNKVQWNIFIVTLDRSRIEKAVNKILIISLNLKG